jgi:ribosome-associated toxin RatA of RatAB toxin-antitoxin module
MECRKADMVAMVLLCLSISLMAAPAGADNGNEPHPHQGVLAPYEPNPLDITLDEEQLERLAEGKLVIMTIENADTGGTGIGIIDIAAPPDMVWSRITGFEHYPEWIGPVDFCEVYHQSGDTTNTHVKISGFLYSYEYFLTNVFWPEHDMLIWTLDYSRESEFDDCVGVWFVEPHPEKEGWTRAWFSSDLKLHSPIPGFIMNFIKKKGIKDATAWVKEQSEAAVQATPDSPE